MTNNEKETTLTLPTIIRVLLPNGRVEEMKLETYLAGAVAAEIGTTAPLEALKAQAVAARTYAVSAQRHPEHNADVCTTTHCQKWKRVDPMTAPEVFRALSETWGMVATYDGNLISSFFFEHCDGHTRSAEEMHIPALGYLRGVDCPCGFLTLKGHGVGMCKRGAIVMARRGATFDQILRHYYRGITVTRTTSEMPTMAEPAPSVSAPTQVAPKAPRTRQVKASAVAPVESPKPKRRVTRRASQHAIEEPPASPPVIEITAVPASVALKRIPLAPTARAAGVESAGQTEPAPVTEKPATPAEPTPVTAEKPVETTPAAIQKPVPPSPAEPAAPKMETTPVDTAHLPRLTLDLPTPRPAPTEPIASAGEPAPTIAWRLAKPEPIEATPAAPAPASVEETPSMIARRVHVDHLPGERMICGSLPRPNVVVMIEDPHGETTVLYSGTAPHYGDGGFEMIVAEDGKYIVTIGGRAIEVEVQNDTVFIQA